MRKAHQENSRTFSPPVADSPYYSCTIASATRLLQQIVARIPSRL